MAAMDGLRGTYVVWVGEGATEPAQVLPVKVISITHVALLNLLLLHLGQGGFLVHAAAELVRSLTLRPNFTTSWLKDQLINPNRRENNLLFLAFYRQVQKMESVPDEVKLDSFVEWAIRAKAGQMIDFNEPRLELLINHNVHAQDLETHRVF